MKRRRRVMVRKFVSCLGYLLLSNELDLHWDTFDMVAHLGQSLKITIKVTIVLLLLLFCEKNIRRQHIFHKETSYIADELKNLLYLAFIIDAAST